MPWISGHYRVSHPREPWDSDPAILIHANTETLKGHKDSKERAQYEAAKKGFDLNAAKAVVSRVLSKDTQRAVIAHTISRGMGGRIVTPHPSFDDEDGAAAGPPTNALPISYANYLGIELACEVDGEIIQTARAGRTKLSKIARFLYQPSFGGAVRPEQPYILADDVVTTAGTLAALRSYILRNGGTIAFSTALAGNYGNPQQFGVADATIKDISNAYGPNFNEFWTETFGHDIRCLTEIEARALLEWSHEQFGEDCQAGDALLQRLRNRFDEAATNCR